MGLLLKMNMIKILTVMAESTKNIIIKFIRVYLC